MPAQSGREHPSVVPWHEFKQFIQPDIVLRYELDPSASRDEHLAVRRELAALVVQAGHRVIDTIDQNP